MIYVRLLAARKTYTTTSGSYKRQYCLHLPHVFPESPGRLHINFVQVTATEYGIDWHGPLPDGNWNEDSQREIAVPQVNLPMHAEVLQPINPLSNSQTFGLDIYMQLVQSITDSIAA